MDCGKKDIWIVEQREERPVEVSLHHGWCPGHYLTMLSRSQSFAGLPVPDVHFNPGEEGAQGGLVHGAAHPGHLGAAIEDVSKHERGKHRPHPRHGLVAHPSPCGHHADHAGEVSVPALLVGDGREVVEPAHVELGLVLGHHVQYQGRAEFLLSYEATGEPSSTYE